MVGTVIVWVLLGIVVLPFALEATEWFTETWARLMIKHFSNSRKKDEPK